MRGKHAKQVRRRFGFIRGFGRIPSTSRNDHVYLFSNPLDAARLREAYDDAVAGRNGIALSREELWRLAGLEPDGATPGDA